MPTISELAWLAFPGITDRSPFLGRKVFSHAQSPGCYRGILESFWMRQTNCETQILGHRHDSHHEDS